LRDLLRAPWQAQIALATLFVALAVSAVTDLRRRLILNAVTWPSFAVILGCAFSLGGWPLAAEGVLGAFVCALPFFIGYALKAVGAGDVKLMLVCGIAAGWPLCGTVVLFVSLAGGAQAVLWIAFAKVLGRERPRHVPYAVAIAAGTFAAFAYSGV
jgi:prepilin peptidase CpaA